MSGKKGEHEPEKEGVLATIWDYAKTFLIIFLVVFALNKLVYINAVIPSESMQTTIMKGDRVIFKYPDDPSKIFIKRVIGLPGETVEVKDGKVYIDGAEKPLDDSFCNEVPIGDFGPYEVPQNCYFMMGDNRNNSLDSRYWKNHFVEKDAILAKAVFRYWPFSEIGKVE